MNHIPSGFYIYRIHNNQDPQFLSPQGLSRESCPHPQPLVRRGALDGDPRGELVADVNRLLNWKVS